MQETYMNVKALINQCMENSSGERIITNELANQLVSFLHDQLSEQTKPRAAESIAETGSDAVKELLEISDLYAHLASNEDNRERLEAAGAVPVLLQLIRSTTEDLQVLAWVQILANLALDHDIGRLAVDDGVVSTLVSLCCSEMDLLKGCAACALANLASDGDALDDEVAKKLVAAEVIPTLPGLLGCETTFAQLHGARLVNMLSLHPPYSQAIEAAGCIPLLETLLYLEEVQQMSAASLRNLSQLPANRAAMAEKGLVEQMVQLFKSSTDDQLREHAITAIMNCALDEDLHERMAQAGLFPALAEPLQSGSLPLQTGVVSAAMNLARYPASRARLADIAIPTLVQLCSPSSETQMQEHSSGALMNLALGDALHERLVGEGAIPALLSILRAGSPDGKANAAGAFINLTQTEAIRAIVVDVKTMKPFAQLGTSSSAANGQTCSAEPLTDSPTLQAVHQQIVEGGGLSALAQLLQSGHSPGERSAAGALLNLSLYENMRGRIVNAGAGKPLAQLCSSSSKEVQERAAGTLMNLALTSALHDQLAQAGAVAALVEVLDAGSVPAQRNAAGALLNLTKSWALRSRVAEAGGIRPLLRLCSCSSGEVQERAAGVLMNLALAAPVHDSLAEAGALEVLMDLLKTGPLPAQRNAAGAVLNLSQFWGMRGKLADAGAIDPLLKLCSSSTEDVQTPASGTLMNLSLDEALHERLEQHGVVAALPALLQARGLLVQRCAAGTAMNLAMHAPNRRILIQSGAVEPLLQFFKPGTDAILQEYAITAVMNLAADVALHEQLVEADVISPLRAPLQEGPKAVQIRAAGLAMNLSRSGYTKVHFVKLAEPLLELAVKATDPELRERASAALRNVIREDVEESMPEPVNSQTQVSQSTHPDFGDQEANSSLLESSLSPIMAAIGWGYQAATNWAQGQ